MKTVTYAIPLGYHMGEVQVDDRATPTEIMEAINNDVPKYLSVRMSDLNLDEVTEWATEHDTLTHGA